MNLRELLDENNQDLFDADLNNKNQNWLKRAVRFVNKEGELV